MIESDAKRILFEVKAILDHNGIPFWLESGVLLGAIRESGFIEWDLDIDIGTSAEYLYKMKDIAKIFYQNDYVCYFSIYHNMIGLWKDGISIDLPFWRMTQTGAIMPLKYAENALGKIIFYFQWLLLFTSAGKTGNRKTKINYRLARHYLSRLLDLIPSRLKISIAKKLDNLAVHSGNRRGLVVTPAHHFEELDTIEFYGKAFNIPSSHEEYLIYYFGDDWRIPKREWNYTTETEDVLSKTEHPGLIWNYELLRVSMEKLSKI